MVVGGEAAAERHGGEEHLALAEHAALEDDAALGDHGAEPRRGGLHEVAPRLDGLDGRGGHLLRRDLGRAVGRRVGGHDQQLGAGPHRFVAAAGVEDLEGDQEPEGPGRRAQQAGAVAGDGVDGDAREVGEVREEGAERHVLAEGHPVHLLEHADDVAARPPGHDLVAEVVADAGSVTPTTSVVRSCRARRPRRAAWGEPASGRSRATTSSGHSTSAGRGGRGHGEVAASCASKTEAGGTCSLLTPRCPPPWTSATRSVRTGAPPSGATVPATARATIPPAIGGCADGRRPADAVPGPEGGARAWRARPRPPTRRR